MIDLIVLDIYKLRRFQCRDDRTLIPPNKMPQLQFNLNTDLEQNIGGKQISIKKTEIF